MAYVHHATASGISVMFDHATAPVEGEFEVFKLDIGGYGEESGPVGLTNPLPVRQAPAKKLELGAEEKAKWENNDTVEKQKTAILDLSSAILSPSGGVRLVVQNPSKETSLAGELQVEWKEGATVRWAKLASFTVLTENNVKADGEAFLFDAGAASKLRVSLRNNSAIGAAGTFTALVQAWVF